LILLACQMAGFQGVQGSKVLQIASLPLLTIAAFYALMQDCSPSHQSRPWLFLSDGLWYPSCSCLNL